MGLTIIQDPRALGMTTILGSGALGLTTTPAPSY